MGRCTGGCRAARAEGTAGAKVRALKLVASLATTGDGHGQVQAVGKGERGLEELAGLDQESFWSHAKSLDYMGGGETQRGVVVWGLVVFFFFFWQTKH